MKIAITGATGFVGSRLVSKLQAQGLQVTIFTRNSNYARKVIPSSSSTQSIEKFLNCFNAASSMYHPLY